MLSVKEASEMLGVSGARVRKLISNGVLPAKKISNTWILDEKDVLDRLSRHPGAGRPKLIQNELCSMMEHSDQRIHARTKKAKKLYSECKKVLSVIPDQELMDCAESAEEADFYISVSDFFLQQKQRELIERGVF